jgi:hypothetical protein
MWKPLDVAQHLLAPLLFMSLSACFFPITIYNLITSLQFSVLFSPSAFKDAWFANFWEKYGPGTRENATLNAQPLIAQSRGVVLDIGPGSGEWLHLFPKGKVSRIYGVEPNKDHHELLRKRVKAAGLTDVYVIVPVGVEHLGENWVGLGEVDTVVTIQVCLLGSSFAGHGLCFGSIYYSWMLQGF